MLELPPLRQDLDIYRSAEKPDGSPTWTIHDKVRNCFFRIGWAEFQVISRWEKFPKDLMNRVNSETVLNLTPETLEEILAFLMVNQLVDASGADGSVRLMMQAGAGKMPLWKKMFFQILCFQVPLIKPNRFLKATLPLVKPFFTKTFVFVMAVLAVLSLYLISQQMTAFRSTFLYFFDFPGFVAYLLAIVFAKSIHELGHAYASALFGCNVPSMGVTFMMGCPMLYTNTTETWRLPLRRQRFIVAASGIMAELALAVTASLLWVFLADGALRSACFLLATSGWVMTLCINLSPLMRFDGYYLLSDLWGIDNLKERSSRMAEWKLREILFGYRLPPPEQVSASTRRGLILYALASWAYRLTLFAAIAAAMYHFAFKLLGIVLFFCVIVFFIGAPLAKEVSVWRRNRNMVSNKGIRLTVLGCLAAFVLFILFAPLWTSVSAPALYQDAAKMWLYAPVPAEVKEVNAVAGRQVSSGEVLARLFSQDLLLQYKKNERDAEALTWELNHTDAGRKKVVAKQLSEALAAREGFQKEGERLLVKAPFDGTIEEVSENLIPGEWVNPRQKLFLIRGKPVCSVSAFVPEQDIYRLKPGQKALFYPEIAGAVPEKGSLVSADLMPVASLGDAGILASDLSGTLPVRRRADDEAVPAGSFYRVRIRLDSCTGKQSMYVRRGKVVISAVPETLAQKIKRQVLNVLARETSL